MKGNKPILKNNKQYMKKFKKMVFKENRPQPEDCGRTWVCELWVHKYIHKGN